MSLTQDFIQRTQNSAPAPSQPMTDEQFSAWVGEKPQEKTSIMDEPIAANTEASHLSDIPKEVGKMAANFATFPLRTAKTLYDIPGQAVNLVKEAGVNPLNPNNAVSLFSQGLAGTEGKILSSLGAPGKYIAGAVSNIVSKMTGKSIDPDAEKFFTTTEAPKEIEKFVVEHPEQLMLILDGLNKSLTKSTGQPVDVVSDTAKKTGIPQAIDKVTDAIPKPSDITGKVNPEEVTPEQVQIARQNVSDVYKKSLPLTPTEQIKEANLLERTGDNTYTTLAKYNISPASEDAVSQLQELSDKFKEAIDSAKSSESKYFNVDEIKQNAIKSINENLSSATERKTAISKLNDEIIAIQEENPASFTKNAEGQTIAKSDVVERLRQTGNDWAQYNKLNPDSVKNSTGRGLANSVRDQIEKEGTFPEYREASREWTKVIHAQEVLQKIADSGKTFKVPGGLTGTVARRILSGIAGFHTAGIGGAVIAELGSEYAAKILSNPDIRTYFSRQILNATDNSPASIKNLTNQVKEYIDSQKNLLKLPSPSSIELGPKTPPESTVKTVPAKAVSIKNPKSGRYEVSYTSEAKTSQKSTAPRSKPR